MTIKEQPSGRALPPSEFAAANQAEIKVPLWRRVLGVTNSTQETMSPASSIDEDDGSKAKPEKWSMGVLNDRQTDEVPGTFQAQCHPGLPRLACCPNHQEIHRGPRGMSAAGSRLTQCLSRLHPSHVQYQAQRAFGSAQRTSQNICLLITFTISSAFKTWKCQTLLTSANIRAFCGREEKDQRRQDYTRTSA